MIEDGGNLMANGIGPTIQMAESGGRISESGGRRSEGGGRRSEGGGRQKADSIRHTA
jgi:hypothetical protein